MIFFKKIKYRYNDIIYLTCDAKVKYPMIYNLYTNSPYEVSILYNEINVVERKLAKFRRKQFLYRTYC